MTETPAGFNRLKTCRHGRMLYNVNDAYVGRSLDLYGEFSEGEVTLFRTFVRPGDIVFDVGANIGVHTVAFGQAVGPTGAVLAFEPQRLVFQTLCANVALNDLANVWCVQQALGEHAGRVPVPALDPRAPNNFAGLELAEAPPSGVPTDTVPMVRADSLQVPGCRLLKIDVEGMEIQVLRGATALVERFRPLLYVENDRAERSDELIRCIDALGYAMFWHTPPLYNPENFFGNPENVFGAIVSKNMLCVPRESDVTIDAPRVEVPGTGGAP